jgi:para-nitrobenzyl esterase
LPPLPPVESIPASLLNQPTPQRLSATQRRPPSPATPSIVETESGKVRGYTRRGIVTFKGIPYGADTSGANRFMPPQKAGSWTGIRSSMQYGWVSPQPAREGWKNDEEAWLFSWSDGIQNEDCLRLNIWTPGINDNKKRPVLVWLHGGGCTAGCGNELLSYHGEILARRGDAVIVSINHRLNVVGHLNLASFGHQYASSANAGMLDIVASLQWVRTNIANFGGDPGVVTIFGQSGGGGKVNTMMAMPAAQGLYHRGIVESGSILQAGTQEDSSALAHALLKELGIDESSVGKLQQVPIDHLVKAGVIASRRTNPTSDVVDFRRVGARLGWGPVVDGDAIPQQTWDPKAPAISAKVPLLVGNTLNEFVTATNHPEFMLMTDNELQKRVETSLLGKSAAVIAAFRAAYPNAKPYQLWSVIATSRVRSASLAQARLKAERQAAPAYLYQFTWQTPVLDGRPMAFHCSEIAFVFDNVDRCENMTGGGASAHALASKMSEAWLHFARSGDPNHSGLPEWAPYAAATNATMIFDDNCALKNNFDDDLQQLINQS